MKNQAKRLLSVLLAVIMLLSVIPVVNGFAASSGKCGGNLTWEFDNNGTLTISGKGYMTDWEYGSTVQPPWTNIRERVKKLVIKKGVTSIGSLAFNGCENLKSIELPDGIEKIGVSAFSGTAYTDDDKNWENGVRNGVLYIGRYLIGAYFNCPNNYKVKSGTRVISDSAFAYGSITSITLPDSLIGIGIAAFYVVPIKSIKIPDGVKVIGERAFEGCSFQSVTIPKSVKKIGDCAFGYTSVQDNIKRSGFKIYGYKGSAAESYAKKNSFIKFITLSDSPIVSLSKTTFTYNGKVQRTSVVVKDRTGKVLKNGTDYTVKYSSGCKNVGQYTVTVTFKGKYSGTKTLTFKIVPKGTSVSKLTAGKKQFTAKWSAQTAQTTGYELQYSTSSSMSGAKKVSIGKNKTTSSTVKKLKGKKKYYVRVRTYKTVKVNSKNVKIYSAWSKTRNVKTK